MAIAPLQFQTPQAPSDLGFNLMPSLSTLGKALSPQPSSLANLGQQYGTSQTPTATPSSSNYAQAISGIESSGNYNAIGPATRSGDKAYGKYQIMGANIPEWTKATFGYSMTPAQFLADPSAQDAVFKHQFGQYVDKYGPAGAAKAWFAGEGGMNNPNASDLYGTTVQSYADKFIRNLGQ